MTSLSHLESLTNLVVFSSSKDDEHDMDVDTAASVVQGPAKHCIPELEIFCYLIVLIYLIDQKRYNEVTLHFLVEIEVISFL